MSQNVSQPSIVFGMNTAFAVRQFLPEVLETARRRGFRPVVLAPEPASPPDGSRQETPAVAFRSVPIRREISPVWDLWCLWRIWSILIAIRPAVTNMSTPKMALLGGLAAWLARVPSRIYTLRGLRYQTTRSWKRLLLIACERVACACAHQVICVSRSVKDTAIRDRICDRAKLALLGDAVSEGIAVGPRSVTPASELAALRRRCGIPDGAPVIGYVGRLTKDKGIADLAASFKILRSQGLPLHLLLIGDFEPEDPVDEATAAWIRSSPDVHWLGYVPQPRRYFELMDVFVFPTHREGLGRVVLEAAAAGKPVVSTRTTGIVDVVQDGVTGILVPPQNPSALALATSALIRDRNLAQQMGSRARFLVEQHFDNTVYLERLGAMLEAMNPLRPELPPPQECGSPALSESYRKC
jgi:glycosyltransferase involved in cell wall biosynthesis